MGQVRSIKDSECIRSKLNNTGGTIAKGTVCKLNGVVGEAAVMAATTDDVYGVAMADIADGAMGDFQIRGKALVLSGGALATPGTLLMSSATGKAAAWAAGAGTNANVLGIQETTASGADELIEVELAGPATSKQG